MKKEMAVMNRKTNRANARIYSRMPDGSVPDYNRINDAADEVLSTNKIANKESERFFYQYADALRNLDTVWYKSECIDMGLEADQKRYMKNPSMRLKDLMDREDELIEIKSILRVASEEHSDARAIVASVICRLQDTDEKRVMVAHYICGAEWKRISEVYGHQDRWAKEKHNVAIKKLGDISTSTDADRNQVQTGRDETQSMHGILEMLSEIRRLETEWENDEYKWQVDEQNKPVMPDDIKLVFGV